MTATDNITPELTEQQISDLVDRFYDKVRKDDEIGPIFNAIVGDWPHHLAKMKDFWSSAMLRTGRYRGHPMMVHLQLPVDAIHFQRWLSLFEETAYEVFPPIHAADIVDKAQRIAINFQAGIAYQRMATA